MKTVIDSQLPIDFSFGKRTTDNCPKQVKQPNFKAFADFIWQNGSIAKGLTYICSPFEVGAHKDAEKYPGHKTWRQKHLVKPRRFLPLDIDGMTPDAWIWLRHWLRTQQINCCWYTTSSHTPTQPRARLLVELNRPTTYEEGTTLGTAFEAHIQANCPYPGAIKFDPSVYRGEQPAYLPVLNEQTTKHTEDDPDCRIAITDQQALDVEHFLAMVPKVDKVATAKPSISAWQEKSIAEQMEHVEVFKTRLRQWAEAGVQHGFDNEIAQEKEAALRQAGAIWNWCWVFDDRSRAEVLAELTKRPVNKLGDDGRIKWLATVTLAARLAPVDTNDADLIEYAIFQWSEQHECYEDDYDCAMGEFDRIWHEGLRTTSQTNLPIKLLLELRKQKKCLPKLLMADGTELDVLARADDISEMFNTKINLSYAEMRPNLERLFSGLNRTGDGQQLVLFDEPHAEEQAAVERFRFWATSELDGRASIQWRVRNVLPKFGLAAVYGASGSGKTFFVLDLLARISLGLDFFGYKTTPCPVVYVCLEGVNGVSRRLKAWEKEYKTELPSSFRIMPDQLSLANQDANQFALAVSRHGLGGGVIVIDTLNQSAPTADENSSKDMGTIIQNAQAIQRMTNSLVILVHHTGKDKSRGLRGHSSLIAALDAAIEVKVGLLGREWSLSKAKDAESFAGKLFRLEPVDLGADEEGESIVSCVAAPDLAAVFKIPPPTGKNQKVVFEAVQQALSRGASLSKDQAIELAKQNVSSDSKRQVSRTKEALEALIESGHIVLSDEGELSLG